MRLTASSLQQYLPVFLQDPWFWMLVAFWWFDYSLNKGVATVKGRVVAVHQTQAEVTKKVAELQDHVEALHILIEDLSQRRAA